MWYEILPSAAIMYVALIIPGLSTLYIQRYLNNGKVRALDGGEGGWDYKPHLSTTVPRCLNRSEGC